MIEDAWRLLLRWVDFKTTASPGDGVARAEFTGSADLVPFTDDESTSGATFLVDNGPIKTMNTMQWPHTLVWVTELGIECCDSGLGIPDFISHRRRRQREKHFSHGRQWQRLLERDRRELHG